MALDASLELKLDQKGALKYFRQNKDKLLNKMKIAYDQTKVNLPVSVVRIRPDDVAKALKLQLEVDRDLQNFLVRNGMRGDVWITRFSYLVIDRFWDEVNQ